MMLRGYSIAEVALHKSPKDCWLVLDGCVYDVTRYLNDHPGGRKILLEHAGTDASEAFEETGHSDEAKEDLQDYKIGVLQIKKPFDRRRIYLAILVALLALLLYHMFKR